MLGSLHIRTGRIAPHPASRKPMREADARVVSVAGDTEPVLQTSGIVEVDHDQFVVSNDDTDTLDVQAKGTLIEVDSWKLRSVQ